jgi:hypothetical protein
MQQYVGIRMAHQPFGMGNQHAAQNKLAPAAKAVGVKAMTDAKFLRHGSQTEVGSQALTRITSQSSGHGFPPSTLITLASSLEALKHST